MGERLCRSSEPCLQLGILVSSDVVIIISDSCAYVGP